MIEKTDAVVIGAGVVGLAVARRLACAGRETVIVEAADRIGTEISSHNSEAIHAGIYYPENSLKARLCVAGKDQLYTYCADHGIAHNRAGKLIVAVRIYNLGSTKTPTVKELISSLINTVHSKSFLIPTWGYGVKQILNMLDILNITLLYPEQFLLADSEFVLDVSDLEDELGFKPKFHEKDMLLAAYKSYEEGF